MCSRPGCEASPALSIVLNGPDGFKGRTLGILASGGADADIVDALTVAAKAVGAKLKFVAPKICGFTDSTGKKHRADEMVDGGPNSTPSASASTN